jgi:hypothetical protein
MLVASQLRAGEGVGLSNLFSLDLRPIATTVESPVGTAVPARARLAAPFPNPFNSSITLVYQVYDPGDRHSELSIVGVDGRRVRRLHSGPITAGNHTFRWDGRSDTGHKAGSGVYLAVVTSGGGRDVRKILFIR